MSATRTSLVLTVIGDDRPGIVEQLSDRVLAAGANWEESRMARLAGKFAGLLRVSVGADQASGLAASLETLGGLRVVVEQGGGDHEAFQTLGVELLGNDRPGIIRDISRVLSGHGVNIEELESELTTAPMSGEALFRARARLRVPATVSLDDLRRTLEALADDLVVDLTFDDRR
jgi:glycine cleavage system regulatory protein